MEERGPAQPSVPSAAAGVLVHSDNTAYIAHIAPTSPVVAATVPPQATHNRTKTEAGRLELVVDAVDPYAMPALETMSDINAAMGQLKPEAQTQSMNIADSLQDQRVHFNVTESVGRGAPKNIAIWLEVRYDDGRQRPIQMIQILLKTYSKKTFRNRNTWYERYPSTDIIIPLPVWYTVDGPGPCLVITGIDRCFKRLKEGTEPSRKHPSYAICTTSDYYLHTTVPAHMPLAIRIACMSKFPGLTVVMGTSKGFIPSINETWSVRELDARETTEEQKELIERIEARATTDALALVVNTRADDRAQAGGGGGGEGGGGEGGGGGGMMTISTSSSSSVSSSSVSSSSYGHDVSEEAITYQMAYMRPPISTLPVRINKRKSRASIVVANDCLYQPPPPLLPVPHQVPGDHNSSDVRTSSLSGTHQHLAGRSSISMGSTRSVPSPSLRAPLDSSSSSSSAGISNRFNPVGPSGPSSLELRSHIPLPEHTISLVAQAANMTQQPTRSIKALIRASQEDWNRSRTPQSISKSNPNLESQPEDRQLHLPVSFRTKKELGHKAEPTPGLLESVGSMSITGTNQTEMRSSAWNGKPSHMYM
jgi:hypothetical protein